MKYRLRIYSILLVFLTTSFWAACGGGDGTSQVSNTNFEASETFFLPDVDAGSRTLFGLTGENGDVTVTGSPGALSVAITCTKRVRSESFEDAQAHLADLDVVVDLNENPSAVFVETVEPQDTGGRIYEVDYTVTLPSDFVVLVDNFNGNVTIDGIDNTVSVVAFNGDVTLGQINGAASATLFNGTIDSGVTLPVSGEIKFDVVNGAINLDIPVSTSAGFIASVVNGSINITNLDLNIINQSPNLLEGTLGSGQGTIDLEIDNGDINVSGF